jgi:hypothetical protein
VYLFWFCSKILIAVQLVASFAGVYFDSLISGYAMESRFLRLKDQVAPEASVFRDVTISVPDGAR